MRNMTKRRILTILLAISCAASLLGCKDNKVSSNTLNNTSSRRSASSETLSSAEDSTPSSEKSETVVYDTTEETEYVIVDNPYSIKTYTNEWNIYEMLKTYTNSNTKTTEEEFLASVGYMQEDKIIDTLFDTFVFLPSPSEEIGIEMDQEYILNYINNSLYRTDYNMNALEKATDKVKGAIGDSNYKVNVFLPLFRPLETVTDFGEYNGIKIDCSTEEGRLRALEWFIDTHIAIFNSKGFKNIKLVGFYWFDEYANSEDYSLIQGMNDYVHSKNYITNWSPYYKAKGYSDWKELKFDIATMQSNYFPAYPGGLNAGDISRLSSNAAITELRGMGMELESYGYSLTAGIRGFKETMQSMLTNGRIDFVHMYYIDGGPECVYDWYTFKTQYGQSAYHELYRFIKRTLKSEDILF